MQLGLACRLERELRHALGKGCETARVIWIEVGRPGSGQCLIECPLGFGVRHEAALQVALEREILLSPPARRLCPHLGHLAESVEPGAGILAALGIVGRRGAQTVGLSLAALEHRAVERRHRRTELRGLATDLVESQQAVVAIEGRVLDRLGHQRAARLLETNGELQGDCLILGRRHINEGQALHKVECLPVVNLACPLRLPRRCLDDRSIHRIGTRGRNVSAIERQYRNQLDHR